MKRKLQRWERRVLTVLALPIIFIGTVLFCFYMIALWFWDCFDRVSEELFGGGE